MQHPYKSLLYYLHGVAVQLLCVDNDNDNDNEN